MVMKISHNNQKNRASICVLGREQEVGAGVRGPSKNKMQGLGEAREDGQV